MLIALLLALPGRAQQLEVADAEQAIRQVASRFTDAFDRGDARAIVSHFTADAVYINDQGQRFVGRSEIQNAYQTLLQRNSDLKLVSEIDSIRLINATTGNGVEVVATNTLSHQGDDTLRWKSTDRFADGVRLADIDTLILKRQE